MMKTFDIETETLKSVDYPFQDNQNIKAALTRSERIFKFRYVGRVDNLPKYIWHVINDAGYEPHYLGGSSFKYSVIGLSKKIQKK